MVRRKVFDCTRQPAVKRIDVTDLDQKQRRQLFLDRINQDGFTGSTKNQQAKQAHFISTYEN
jgi:hypothetical protein